MSLLRCWSARLFVFSLSASLACCGRGPSEVVIAVDCSGVTGVGGPPEATMRCSEAVTEAVEKMGMKRDPDVDGAAFWSIEARGGLHRSVIRIRDEDAIVLTLGDAKSDVLP